MKYFFVTALSALILSGIWSSVFADDLDWVESIASKNKFWGTIMIPEKTIAGGSYGYARSLEDALSKASGVDEKKIRSSLESIDNFYAAETRAKQACERGIEIFTHLKNHTCRMDSTYLKRVEVIAGYHRFLIDVSYTAQPSE